MKLKNIVVFTAIISSSAFANSLTSVSIYGTPLIYKSSIAKKDGYFLGSYFYFGYSLNHVLEAEIDYIKINFKDGKTLNQNNFSASYTNFYGNRKIKIGTYFIKNDEKNITPQRNTDNGIIITLGYSKFKLYQWELGGEFHTSYYSNYKVNGNSLKVFQINGILIYGEGNFYKKGRTYITIKPYVIYIPDSPTGKKTYTSLEGSFSYYISRWVFSGIGYIGKTLFAVKNGGLLVYNVAEERLYGIGGSIKYILNKNSSIYLSVFNDTFRDELSTNEANLTTLTLGAGFSF
ncbi:MAG: hypothetical protein DSY47_08200 [Hydrogenothermus sp.]|nr:MAG: hypothetical protein DSY47_08200 [Hydrogenothermus sp.]